MIRPPFDLMSRFCLSNVIAYGQTFLDLVLHCANYIRANMKISYEAPEPSWQQFGRRIIHISLAKRLQGPHDKDNDKRRKLRALIQRFLNIFNGDWKQWDPSDLCHHCHVRCACGGLRRAELADMAATTFIELVLFSRPPIPALSRWLKCSETAKWYLSRPYLVQITGESTFCKDWQWLILIRYEYKNEETSHCTAVNSVATHIYIYKMNHIAHWYNHTFHIFINSV